MLKTRYCCFFYPTLKLVLLLFFINFSLLTWAAEPLRFQLYRQLNDAPVAVTENTWNNQYVLIAVGFTGCPDVCPTTLLDMRDALRALDNKPAVVKRLQPLFITIDPLSDSLENITEYAAYFDSRIIGLRAENFEKLDHVVKQLRASYGYQFQGKIVTPPNLPKGYTVSHSTYIYLYAPDGKLVDVYPYNMAGEEIAKRLLKYLKP